MNEERIQQLAKAMLKGMHYPTDFTPNEIIAILQNALSIVEEDKKQQETDLIAQGEKIADIASRLLNKEMTADDLAYCVNQYIKSNHLDLPSNITGATVIKVLDKTQEEINKQLSPVNTILNLLDKKTDDEKIRKFLQEIIDTDTDTNI